jgi:non-ribosomal peptide synthase protein (TIGR01720 family)
MRRPPLALTETVTAEALLTAIAAELLREPVDAADNFFDLGGDSILALQLVAHARASGLAMTIRSVYEAPSFGLLAELACGSPSAAADDDAHLSVPVPLVPSQLRLFDWKLDNPDYYNTGWALAVRSGREIDVAAVEAAARALVRGHDALRMRFPGGDYGFLEADGSSADAVATAVVDAVKPLRPRALVDASAALHRALRIGRGPLLGVHLVRSAGSAPTTLLFGVHHLVCDAYSAYLLQQDFASAYIDAERGRDPLVARVPTSFRAWAETMRAYAESDAPLADLEYWAALPWGVVRPLPSDRKLPEYRGRSARAVAQLSEEATDAFLAVRGRDEATNVLLAAVASAVSSWSGQSAVLIDVYRHGRDPRFTEVDLSRTVGFVASITPALFVVDPDAPPVERRGRVVEQAAALPEEPHAYGALRYVHRAPELTRAPAARMVLNYHGQLASARRTEGLFADLLPSPGAIADPHQLDHYTLRFDCAIVGGVFELHLGYNRNRYHAETARALALSVLAELSECCLGRTRAVLGTRGSEQAPRRSHAGLPL